MNKQPTQTRESIFACAAFADILKHSGRNQIQLAKLCGLERKTVMRWIHGGVCPRLDDVAKICAALGMDEIRLPLREVNNETNQHF